MSNEKPMRKERKDPNQNIQVFVRLRPLNQREKDIKSLGVVEVVNGREVVVRPSNHSLHTKKFTFDRAFPPHSKQVEVYQDVVSPLIEEVLAGYNCTVFAYGQTGTGKTHTMVGEAACNETTWQNDPMAGIIPRALSQLFDELRISNTEYTVRVSYLELYNEELFDLLANSDDNSKLRIYEDVTRKGSNIVNGLEEVTVYNKNEVYRIMSQGQERKRVASTLMNSQSSRSHTVFTIVVHMKENSPEGEELVKIGKLNLVDLAGSENISKAGSDNPAKRERARECVNINQSLLTLGRVITALVERHPHIPYRESKLTRILQESLGGRTKTSIIATISPGHKDIEETLSTLEYANRAKNIQNKPEINQKMTKKAILKEYAEEIDKLKRDLQASRDKNGIYLANETYSEMTFKQEEQRKEIQELLLKKRAMEEEKDRMEHVFKELNDQLHNTAGKLDTTLNQLSTTETKLANTTNKLQTTVMQCQEQRHLVSQQQKTEEVLSTQALQLLAAADAASNDAGKLHDSVDKRRCVELNNLEITRTYREVSTAHRDNINNGADQLVGDITSAAADIQSTLETYTRDSTQLQLESKRNLERLIQNTVEFISGMMKTKNMMCDEIDKSLASQRADLLTSLRAGQQSQSEVLESFASGLMACLQRALDMDLTTLMAEFLNQWVSEGRSRVSQLRGSHDAVSARALLAAEQHTQAALRVRDAAAARCDHRASQLSRLLQVFVEDKQNTEETLTKDLITLERERAKMETSLLQWIESKKKTEEDEIERRRKLLEEEFERRRKIVQDEIEERVRVERSCWDEKLKINKENIEKQKKLFEERTARNVQWLQEILAECEREKELSEAEFRQSATNVETYRKDLQNFAESCEQNAAAIATSIEVLQNDALNVTERLKLDLVNSLKESQLQVQEQTNQLLRVSETSTSEREVEVTRTLDTVANCCKTNVNHVLAGVEQNTSLTTSALNALASSASEGIELACTYRDRQASSLAMAQRSLEQFYGGLREELNRLAELESRYLHEEYAVYTPSGHTPARTRYRYPRDLVATSPHERILARYRASRADSVDDDCIVVEDEMEGRISDEESSASEDAAVTFATPSSPVSSTRVQKPALIKCTSETDIYLRQKQQDQGKENVNRSMTFKKPSKLPAPSSLKKPLVERNVD